jgi:hypothetical protein
MDSDQDLKEAIDDAWRRLGTARDLLGDVTDLVSRAEGMSDHHLNQVRTARNLLLDKLKADIYVLIAQRQRNADNG